ncbi:hypothetical protein THRCLA_02481 [Thraustotheca clavata]|uniref:Dual specificity phosphatase n=1 Tax=Thraustotheca clavata TaxID=74557 RepID=A0A1W0A5R5_9STRA|nr:hypothetical protein THRCLA_02481 [Thraustotheca clavata]
MEMKRKHDLPSTVAVKEEELKTHKRLSIEATDEEPLHVVEEEPAPQVQKQTKQKRTRNPGNLLLDLSQMETNTPLCHTKKIDYANECSQVTEFLYVGGAIVAAKQELLLAHGITHIINCAATVTPDFFPHLFSYYRLPLRDHATQDIHRHFYTIFQFIDKAREENGKVFVHCVKGISRSPAMAIAYLMARERLSLYPALERVRASRPVIDPNAGFIFQLNEWDALRQQARKQVTVFRIERSDDVDSSSTKNPLIIGPIMPQKICSISPEIPTVSIHEDHQSCCFVVLSMETNYCSVWCGRNVSDELIDSARTAMRLLQTYEAYPDSFDVIMSGHEPDSFWTVLVPESQTTSTNKNNVI